jgi:hypothetical protein
MALYPEPVGCTGWNLWRLLNARTGATIHDYLNTFHRYNLGQETKWHIENARTHWESIEESLTTEFDTIVLLGAAVRRAAGLLLPQLYVSRTVICIPHPSGLNRWYNDETNRQIVEIIMEELYTEARGITRPTLANK